MNFHWSENETEISSRRRPLVLGTTAFYFNFRKIKEAIFIKIQFESSYISNGTKNIHKPKMSYLRIQFFFKRNKTLKTHFFYLVSYYDAFMKLFILK